MARPLVLALVFVSLGTAIPPCWQQAGALQLGTSAHGREHAPLLALCADVRCLQLLCKLVQLRPLPMCRSSSATMLVPST